MPSKIHGFSRILTVAAIAAVSGGAAAAATIQLGAAKDNTLYEDPIGGQSNGVGEHIFTGTTLFSTEIRRAVLAFDLSGIPAGSTITSASLTLVLTKTISAEQPVSLHRLTGAWGEGASNAPNEEGVGAAPEPGDATWLHRFFDATPWASPGGDFDPTPSATVGVTGALIPWVWSSPQMAADVQGWVDVGANNHGWIVVGNEEDSGTAKRFGSRENASPGLRPSLTVGYTPPGAGAIPGTGAAALRLARAGGADLTLAWGGSSCGDTDFAVYAGLLGAPASLAPLACSTSGATSLTLTPGPANTFYLVVPRNPSKEGSYGRRSGGIERLPSASACFPQSISSCP